MPFSLETLFFHDMFMLKLIPSFLHVRSFMFLFGPDVTIFLYNSLSSLSIVIFYTYDFIYFFSTLKADLNIFKAFVICFLTPSLEMLIISATSTYFLPSK